jgi:hypothetical protein
MKAFTEPVLGALSDAELLAEAKYPRDYER